MQCATVKPRLCSSLDNVDMEQQQQSLFDVSIIKLQHEQLRHGVEPRLLRFVLINNALRSLQGHMLHIEDDGSLLGLGEAGGVGGEEIQCESSDIFFYNTFKDGSLSTVPLSPPSGAQVKVVKLDNGFGDQSPLIEFQEAPSPPTSPSTTTAPSSSSSSHFPHHQHQEGLASCLTEERVHPAASSYEEVDEGGGEGGGGGGGREKRLQNGFSEAHTSGVLGKRGREWSDDANGTGGGSGLREVSRCRSLDYKDQGMASNGGGGVGVAENSGVGVPDPKKPCKPSSLIINSTIQKVQNGLNSLSTLNGFLDLVDPFPSMVFPSSPPSPTGSSLSASSPSSPSSPSLHFHHHPHYPPSPASSTEDSDKDSLTPSPIDFTNVDPTLYDFDTAVLHMGSTDAGVCSLSPPPEGVSLASSMSLSHVTTTSGHVTTTGASCHVTDTSCHVTDTSCHVTLVESGSSQVQVVSHTTTTTTSCVTSSCSPSHASQHHHLPSLPSPLCASTATVHSDLSSLPPPTHPQLVGEAAITTSTTSSCSSTTAVLTPTSTGQSSLDASLPLPHHLPEPEKMSVVSADSMVVTAVPASAGGMVVGGGGTGVIPSSAGGSCAMEAIVSESGRLSHDASGGPLGDGTGLASSAEHGVGMGVEPDYMDDIDHIVNLLMT